MKKLIWTLTIILAVSVCFGQRYELWVKTSDSNNRVKRNFGFSNDSVLMTFSNSSLFFPSKDTHFSWDDITGLKVRNKSKNQIGILLGTGAGVLAVFMISNSLEKSNNELGSIGLIFCIPIIVVTGTLIGHLATNKKRKIPLRV